MPLWPHRQRFVGRHYLVAGPVLGPAVGEPRRDSLGEVPGPLPGLLTQPSSV